MRRRDFLGTGLAAASGALWLSSPSGAAPAPSETLDVALIGGGLQGRRLMNVLLTMSGVRLRAVCDIWKYRRTSALAYLATYQHEAVGYEDYHEMLDKAKGLQAVVVATPDFVHAEQAQACLEAGLHVYCEPPMAPTLPAAQAMAEAARRSGKLLAIGYQRRSNLRYQHVDAKLLREAELLDDITSAGSQWNQPELDELGWPSRHTIADADLKRYGYADMREFRNWRWFRRYCAGPFAGFAVHQVDVLNWLLGSRPRAVLAAGGTDYYENRQCYDNVTAIFEYPLAERVVRATCQVSTSSRGTNGNFELITGTAGSIRISENPKWTKVFREPTAGEWDDWRRKGYLAKVETAAAAKSEKAADPNELQVQESGEVTQYEIPVVLDMPTFQPHVENFFDAIRGRAELTCPAEVALPSEAAVLKALEAVEAKRQLTW